MQLTGGDFMKLLTAVLTAATLVFASAAHADPAPSTLSEGFDDISSLSGWAMVNNSTPAAGMGWFQGNSGIFPALSGAGDSYIGASYMASASPAGTVDLWLMTPVLSLTGMSKLLVSMRTADDPGYADQLQIWFGSGSGTDPAAFLMIANSGALEASWLSYVIGSPVGSGEGRFAFRFTGQAETLNYIGLDSVAITTPVPEPATYIMLCIGLALLFGFRHARTAVTVGAIAVSSAAFAGEPPQSGMLVVRDPQTGQLRAPTDAEFRAMTGFAAALQAGQPSAPPKTIVRADGTVQRSMGPEGMSYSVVSRGKDGKLSIDCISGEQAAKEAAGKKEHSHEIQ